MKIADCAHKPVHAGHWHSEDRKSGTGQTPITVREIFHYSTLMLAFTLDTEGRWDDRTPVYISVGHGSVSDQNGMNKLFRELEMPYYYQRKGGAFVA